MSVAWFICATTVGSGFCALFSYEFKSTMDFYRLSALTGARFCAT